MSTVSFEEFTNNCALSEVTLDPKLIEEPLHHDADFCYQPDDWYGAVAKAGEILRQRPYVELVNTPITDQLFGDGSLTLPQMTFKGIINASRDRIANQNPATTFFCRGAKRVDSCSSAEGGFGLTINNMTHGHKARDSRRSGEDYYKRFGWTIIIDDDMPVGITKRYGQPSTLALSPITINGIPYPAGSLLRMNTLKKGYHHEAEERRTFVPGERIAFASFLRLSAFALPAEERKTFQHAIGNVSEQPGEIVRTWSIEKIREIARQAIAYSWPED